MSAATRRDASRDSPSSGQIQTQARRSLDFLSTIENTIDEAGTDVVYLGTMTSELNALLQRLGNVRQPGSLLDPEERTTGLLHLAAAGALRMYEDAKVRRQHARTDPQLTEDDGVVECLDQLIAALADYHNAIETLRDTIETLDSLQSPVIGTYANAEDLIAALRA